MTDTKLRMTVFMLLAVMIGCGGGDEGGGEKEKEKGADPQSRVKQYAPKDAVAAIYVDVPAARKGLADAVKKYPKEAGQIKLDVVTPVLEKIDAIVVYLMQSKGQPLPVVVIHGEVRPGDLTGVLAKLTGAPEAADLKLKGKGNGRYELVKTPILIVDGGEADDLDGNVIVAGMAPTLTAVFVGALGKGECKAVTLALDKADTSALLWGGLAFDKPLDPSEPKSGVFSANLTGDKLFRAEMTFASEKAAVEAEKGMGMGIQMFGPVLAVKRSGATLTMASTKSGNLIDMLVPGIRGAVEGANQASCRANLKGITTGCAMYMAENVNARHPESLKALVDKGVITPGAFQCPSDNSQRACSYLYVAPSREADGLTLMLCDLKGNHEDARSVAFKSGAVTRMSETQFQAALKLPRNAKFAAALKKAGG